MINEQLGKDLILIRQLANWLGKINSSMNSSIQKLKEELKLCSRETSNTKWREKIEKLLEKLINTL